MTALLLGAASQASSRHKHLSPTTPRLSNGGLSLLLVSSLPASLRADRYKAAEAEARPAARGRRMILTRLCGMLRGIFACRFLLTEGRDRVGGNITSMSSPDGYRWEEGPNSFQPNDSMLKAAVSAPHNPRACSQAPCAVSPVSLSTKCTYNQSTSTAACRWMLAWTRTWSLATPRRRALCGGSASCGQRLLARTPSPLTCCPSGASSAPASAPLASSKQLPARLSAHSQCLPGDCRCECDQHSFPYCHCTSPTTVYMLHAQTEYRWSVGLEKCSCLPLVSRLRGDGGAVCAPQPGQGGL